MDLEILEGLALAEDRPAALAKLLPGSEDHDYYRALHAQQRGALADADAVIATWPERHGTGERYDRLRLRQLIARVTGGVDGAAADQLRDWFGVEHRHEAEVEHAGAERPSRLPDGAWDPVALLQEAVERDASLQEVTDEGVLELLGAPLDATRRRRLLDRLDHTPRAEIVALIAADLDARAGAFGELRAHRGLTLAQLHALAAQVPALTASQAWASEVVRRLRPPAGVDLALDVRARAAFLAAAWDFAATLPPANNPLKDHVLWHLLDTTRRLGAPVAPALVEAYLALPRPASYRPARWRAERDLAEHGRDFATVTDLPAAGDDEAVIRAAIEDDPDGAERYAAWLDRAWLDVEIASARLLRGSGTARDTQRLGPARAQALHERVELTWCAHNPTVFAADAPVVLAADVKHVRELVIKVFRIDPVAYFQLHQREVDASVDLDGLAASDERSELLDEPAIRRVRRQIALPACARPGSYVIDLIGSGIASRAVIHKGRLRHVARTSAAGQVVTIFDETGRPRPDARVWIGEREYVPDERGAIVVPFAPVGRPMAMLLVAGDLATVARLDDARETAELGLALQLDRQALSAGRTAQAIAHVTLSIGGAPASLALLRDARWEVTLTDRRGVSTTKAQPLALVDDAGAVLAWPLGDDTARVAIALSGKVDLRSEQRTQDVAAAREVALAEIHTQMATEAAFLERNTAGWVISILGKTGEPRAQRPVSVTIGHRACKLELSAELATDARGRIELGLLPGATHITCGFGDATQRFALTDRALAQVPHQVRAGHEVRVLLPASRTAEDVLRHASLVALRRGCPVEHVRAELVPLAGAIAVRGLAAGDYQLTAPGLAPAFIHVVDGVEVAGWAVTPHEVVELPRTPPAIAALHLDHGLTVTLAGSDARTRVHVIATRFWPAPVEHVLEGPWRRADRRADAPLGAAYVSGRELGDEVRYVLERRNQPRLPQLQLARPSLLLNPWARRQTTTDVMSARGGGGFPPAPAMAAPMMQRLASFAPPPADGDAFASYDFLAGPPVVLANLVPDAHGRVVIAADALAGATTATVIVDDPAGLTSRRVALPEPALATRDLRLALALDPLRHVRQARAIAPLASGEALIIDDLATAEVHLLDTVERAHAYLLGLRDEPGLRELAFVTRWPALTDDERRALYSEHACHELHLFLWHKDRAFFDEVIRPYLANKRTPTFLDHWLLGADLSPYLEPARRRTLNAVEAALLALRLRSEPALARQLDDELAVLPRDPAREGQLIDALLGAATLQGDTSIADAKGAVLAEIAASAPMLDEAPKAKKPARARSLKKEAAPEPQRYRPVDRTQEWAEHNWWRRTPADSGPAMIPVNRLWRDLAHHRDGAFLSPWLGLATGSLAEAMCALAVSDLPFAAPAHAIERVGARLTVRAAGRALAGTSQLVDGELVGSGAPIVVGMSYVRADDRYSYDDGEQRDKLIDGPLLAGVVYTCLVVLANPTSARQRVQALLQLPRGSVAVAGARPTETIEVALPPYGTHGHEYSFYFPAAGRWTHFPVHVSRGGHIVAAAPARTLEVLAGGLVADAQSWAHVSQRGALADVVAYLAHANLAAIDVGRVAWRLRERAAYEAILGALEARRSYDAALWGYALLHRDAPRIRTWLRALGPALLAAGPALDALALDAEDAGGYEHLEYAPLINARAHRLGAARKILNDGFAAQYARFLALVAHRGAPTDEDLLAAASYLLAQDRVPEALAALARVQRDHLRDRLQHDYLAAYAACLTGELATANAIANAHRKHPVDRWRERFAALAAMLDELAGAAPQISDPKSREQQHAELAARQPAFELSVDSAGVLVRSQHLAALELRFFEIDVELLFSRQPFVQSDVARLSFVEPGHRESVAGGEQRVAWPAALRGKNVVVEAVAGGTRKARVHYANDLALTVAQQYGQIRVLRASTGAALPATYLKVYARRSNGDVRFYKDGYTDLRGWFDYASLSTDEGADRLAILVCSDHAGAAILEAAPPGR